MQINHIHTSNADLWVDEDAIAYITFKKGAYETVETLKENALAINYLNGDVGVNMVVVDIKNAKGVSLEARNLSKAQTYIYKSVAIVVENLLSRLLASFFIRFSVPGFPIKIFDNNLNAKDLLMKKKSLKWRL